MPVIVIAGKEDRVVDFARQSERLDEVLKESALIALENGGHMIHHTDPQKVVEAIDQPLRYRRRKIACRRRPYSLNSDSGLTSLLTDESAGTGGGRPRIGWRST
jgi:hypothetical protein